MVRVRSILSALHAFAPVEKSDKINIWNYYKESCFLKWDPTFNSFATAQLDTRVPKSMFTLRYFGNEGETPVQTGAPVTILTEKGTLLGMCRYRIQPIIPYVNNQCKYGWVFEKRKEGGLYIKSQDDMSMCLHADDGVLKVETCRNDRKGMAFMYGTEEMRKEVLDMKKLIYKYWYDNHRYRELEKILASGDFIYNKNGKSGAEYLEDSSIYEERDRYRDRERKRERRDDWRDISRDGSRDRARWSDREEERYYPHRRAYHGRRGHEDDEREERRYYAKNAYGPGESRRRPYRGYDSAQDNINTVFEHVQSLTHPNAQREKAKRQFEGRRNALEEGLGLDGTMGRIGSSFANREAFGFGANLFENENEADRRGLGGRQRMEEEGELRYGGRRSRRSENPKMFSEYLSGSRIPYSPYTYYNMRGYNGPIRKSNICPEPKPAPLPPKKSRNFFQRLFGLH